MAAVLNGQALDSFISLAAMAAITQRIMLISTVHVLYGPWHPLHFAKFGATLDHIAKGRWGVNVVTGHRAVEHEMFGWSRIDHDRRYELAAEFNSWRSWNACGRRQRISLTRGNAGGCRTRS